METLKKLYVLMPYFILYGKNMDFYQKDTTGIYGYQKLCFIHWDQNLLNPHTFFIKQLKIHSTSMLEKKSFKILIPMQKQSKLWYYILFFVVCLYGLFGWSTNSFKTKSIPLHVHFSIGKIYLSRFFSIREK